MDIIMYELLCCDYVFFFKINIGVRASLHAPRLIQRALKLTIM